MEIKHDEFLSGSRALKFVLQAHHEVSSSVIEDNHVLIRDNYSVVYAEDNGVPVGCLVFYRYCLNECFITLAYVAENHRMQGVFKAMFAHLKNLCKGVGMVKIVWGCPINNDNAVAAYRAMGFSPIYYQYSVNV